jgi:hypothetical protein
MTLCDRCIHNTGTDDSLLVEVDFKSGRVLDTPRCELCKPAFPHATECNTFYEVPIDGD